MDTNAIKSRVDTLLAIQWNRQQEHALVAGLVQGTASVLQAVYGPQSQHLKLLQDRMGNIRTDSSQHAGYYTFNTLKGVLENVKGEIEAGFLGTFERSITGEVLGDFLRLANAILQTGEPKTKDVAAVLAAAAFEDVIRKMGAQFCGIEDRDKLSDILIALKTNGVLVGSQFGTIQAQLQFRNDALHADWDKIDPIGVKTLLQLIQEMLLKHFA